MRFILTFGSLSKIDFLRANYEAVRQIDLRQPSSKFRMSLFLGSIDVDGRNAQINFLEKIKMILQADLLEKNEINTPAKWLAHLTASRVMIAACLYVQSQIGPSKSNSVLYRLIDDCLGVTAENYFDEDDRKICFLAANRIKNSSRMPLEQMNEALMKAEKKIITEKEWDDFSLFLEESCRQKNVDNVQSNYPVTSITKPLFGYAFLYSGATIGYLSSIVLSHSSKVTSLQRCMADFLGDKLLFDPLGPIGVAILAPTIASHLLTTYCSFALTHMTGHSMELIGNGLGICVGLPFDLAYQLLCKTSSVLRNFCKQSSAPQIIGVRIVDGSFVDDFLMVELQSDKQLEEDNKLYSYECSEDEEGFINIDLDKLDEFADIKRLASASNGIHP